MSHFLELPTYTKLKIFGLVDGKSQHTLAKVNRDFRHLIRMVFPTEMDNYVLPLHRAGVDGDLAAIQYCINELHLHPYDTGAEGRVLIHAIAMGGQVKALKYYVEKLKLNYLLADADNSNALHYAAVSGNVEAIKYLMELNKDRFSAQRKNRLGNTILHIAGFFGNIAAMEFCLKTLSMDPYDKNTQLMSAENIDAGYNFVQMVVLGGQLSAIRYCLEKCKFDPHQVADNGCTLLLIAGMNDAVNVIEYLIKVHQLKWDVTDKEGNNLLDIALAYNNTKIIAYCTDVLKMTSAKKAKIAPVEEVAAAQSVVTEITAPGLPVEPSKDNSVALQGQGVLSRLFSWFVPTKQPLWQEIANNYLAYSQTRVRNFHHKDFAKKIADDLNAKQPASIEGIYQCVMENLRSYDKASQINLTGDLNKINGKVERLYDESIAKEDKAVAALRS